jgi:hypothetical protein
MAERRGTGRYRINDRRVACFPTAADIVMGKPAPVAAAGPGSSWRRSVHVR